MCGEKGILARVKEKLDKTLEKKSRTCCCCSCDEESCEDRKE